MLKQIIILGFLFIGITAAVLVIQSPTLLKSFGYDVIDFVASFHAKEGDAEYNPNLDIYKDGVINTFDVLKDRYMQEATRAGEGTESGTLVSNEASDSAILESSSSAEASGSAI